MKMAVFRYIAKSEPKSSEKGTIEADSITCAAASLRGRGLFPIHIERQFPDKSRSAVFEKLRLRKAGSGTLARFTEQFANLLEAGVPLERALRLIETQIAHALLKKTIGSIIEMVREGKSLAEALSLHPKIFSASYVSMVRVGEEAGLLADMLRRLSKSLDEEYQLRSRLKAAMVYPVFLICVGLGTVIVLMVWVIPKFSSFFGSLEQELPVTTRIVIEASSFIARVWPFVLIAGALFVLLSLRLLKNKSFRYAFDRFCLRIPVIGGFAIKSQLAQFMRILGILVSHGVNILSALSIAGDTLSNKFIAGQIREAQKGVTKGEKLHECFTDGRIFPATVLGVMAVGQESGTLPDMVLRISEQYEQQTERQIKALTSMIEPVMILVMGGIVGFVVISMLMPIFKVSTLVQ